MNLRISGSTKVIGEPLTLIKPLPALTWATAVADFFLPKVCYKTKNEKHFVSHVSKTGIQNPQKFYELCKRVKQVRYPGTSSLEHSVQNSLQGERMNK